MKVWKIEKVWLSLVLFGFNILGSPMPGMAQQAALTFQPAVITNLAGTGITATAPTAGDGGPGTSALVRGGMKGIVVDASSDVFFFDATAGVVRVIYEGGATAAALITVENPSVTSPVIGNIISSLE